MGQEKEGCNKLTAGSLYIVGEDIKQAMIVL